MRPQRKIMMVETTYAFVKLKQIKAAVSAGGIKFDLAERDVDCSHQDDLCAMALGAAACLANQDWANRSVKNSDSRSVESAFLAPLLIKSAFDFHDPCVEAHDRVSTCRPAPNVSV